MDWKKLIGPVIGIILGVVGALVGIDLKGDVCKGSEAPAAAAVVK
jgi:hypothetical protein